MGKLKKMFVLPLCLFLVVSLLLPSNIALAVGEERAVDVRNVSNVNESITDLNVTEESEVKTENADNNAVTVDGNTSERSLLMQIGSNRYSVTESGVTENGAFETVPLVMNCRTLVPMRFICEVVLKCEVTYLSAEKSAVLKRGDMEVSVDLYGNTVEIKYADGTVKYAETDQKPVIRNNYTYMPLRFFSELFGCRVEYDPTDKSILVVDYGDNAEYEPTPEPIDRPDVSVVLPDYTIGQPTYDFKDYSYDKNGLDFIGYQWKLSANGNVYTDIEDLLKKITEGGNYNIYCRVENSDGIWSAWEKFSLKAVESKAPVIKDFKAVRADNGSATVRSGDILNFTYKIENEEWETVVSEEWSYTWTSNGYTKNMKGKPQALYYINGGYYTVTLKVKDSAGKYGTAVTTVSPKEYAKPMEAFLKFNNLSRGEIYQNSTGVNFNTVKTAEPNNILFDDITLLASNNPESVEEFGILCADKISGNARLRFHHKNCTGENVKFYVTAKNETANPIELTVGTRAAAGPSTGVLQVGVSVVERYLTGGYAKITKVLQPGEIYLINQGALKVPEGSSAAGLIDVFADGELTYSVSCMKAGSSYVNYEYLTPVAKNSTHIRGTFEQSTVSMDYRLSGKKAEKIILGREDAFENYYRTGIDGLTGEDVVNKGNRGVVHKMTVTADKKVGLLFNPRGTAYVGVIMVDGEIVRLSAAGMMKGISEACILDVMEAGETKEITYIVPSGSDSPVLIVAIPENQWKSY